tara:strand:- start:123 stop:926 length:804 start_codon:yes stop_codon:yes gene_type:complete
MMTNKKTRIFTYLPSPRVWKALIAAEILKIDLEIRADKPRNLDQWLWDFDAKPLKELTNEKKILVKGTKGFTNTLKKTKRFLKLNPFGTVPVAFDPKGTIGIFESNSILRLIARLNKSKLNLYGKSAFIKSRVDSFLDASLVFGALTQPFLLSFNSNKKFQRASIIAAENAFVTYMNGIENSLKLNKTKFIISDNLSIADICFFCEFMQFTLSSSKKPIISSKYWFNIEKKHKKNYVKSYKLLEKLIKNKDFKKITYYTLKKYKYYD